MNYLEKIDNLRPPKTWARNLAISGVVFGVSAWVSSYDGDPNRLISFIPNGPLFTVATPLTEIGGCLSIFGLLLFGRGVYRFVRIKRVDYKARNRFLRGIFNSLNFSLALLVAFFVAFLPSDFLHNQWMVAWDALMMQMPLFSIGRGLRRTVAKFKRARTEGLNGVARPARQHARFLYRFLFERSTPTSEVSKLPLD
jgi:hypothetical protein